MKLAVERAWASRVPPGNDRETMLRGTVRGLSDKRQRLSLSEEKWKRLSGILRKGAVHLEVDGRPDGVETIDQVLGRIGTWPKQPRATR